jgi:hypothetical protein
MSPGAYDPETVLLLSSVLNAALADIQTTEPRPLSNGRRSEMSAALAKALFSALEAGERDPRVLKALALKGCSASPSQMEAPR